MTTHHALDESDRRRIATVVSSAGAVVGILSTATTAAFLGLSLQHMIALAVVLSVSGITLFLIHRGAVTFASWFLCILISLLLLGLSWIESGVHAASAPAYFIVIGISALLLGPKECLGFAIAGAISFAGLEVASQRGWLPEPLVEPGHGLVFGLMADAVLLGILLHFAVDRMARAISREREMARSLVEVEARLQESAKMEAIGRLAGGVAHDFNNLMTAVYGYADMVGRDASSSQSRRDAEEIKKAVRRAKELTQYLLTLSRRRVAAVELVDPAALVRDQTDIMSRIIGEQVKLTTKLEDDVGVVSLEPAELARSVMNLVVNASEAMPEGGQIELGVRVTETRDDDLLTDGEYVEVTVSDTGPGIPAETLRHIFEPFYTTKETGTGMGLAIAYGAIKQRGGDIRVDTGPSGTTFRILLPRATSVPAQTQTDPPTAPSPSPSKRILVVDDDPAILRVVQRILSADGHDVESQCTAEEAESRALEERFDLIISDVVMPDRSGPELLRRLAERGSTTPFVLMSGYVRDELGPQAIPKGVLFLEKPFSPRTLRGILIQALGPAPSAELRVSGEYSRGKTQRDSLPLP